MMTVLYSICISPLVRVSFAQELHANLPGGTGIKPESLSRLEDSISRSTQLKDCYYAAHSS
jgi:hypothetical protein